MPCRDKGLLCGGIVGLCIMGIGGGLQFKGDLIGGAILFGDSIPEGGIMSP